MIDVEQRLLEILYLNIVLLQIILFERAVIGAGKARLRIQLITDLGDIEVLRLILIAVPRHDHGVVVLAGVEDKVLTLLYGHAIRHRVAVRVDALEEVPVDADVRAIGELAHWHDYVRVVRSVRVE